MNFQGKNAKDINRTVEKKELEDVRKEFDGKKFLGGAWSRRKIAVIFTLLCIF